MTRTWKLSTYPRSRAECKRLGISKWGATFALADGTQASGFGHTERTAVQRAAAEMLRVEAQIDLSKVHA